MKVIIKFDTKKPEDLKDIELLFKKDSSDDICNLRWQKRGASTQPIIGQKYTAPLIEIELFKNLNDTTIRRARLAFKYLNELEFVDEHFLVHLPMFGKATIKSIKAICEINGLTLGKYIHGTNYKIPNKFELEFNGLAEYGKNIREYLENGQWPDLSILCEEREPQ